MKNRMQSEAAQGMYEVAIDFNKRIEELEKKVECLLSNTHYIPKK